MISYNRNSKGFFSIVGLLLAAALIMVLVYIMMRNYVNPPIDAKEKEALGKSGIDSSSYKGILDSTKKKIQDINKQKQNQANDADLTQEE
ncbi:MAG: hypothetical protein V2A72_05475 [Candidatus Omnitrophota bacterium]